MVRARVALRSAPRCAICARLAKICVCHDAEPMQLRTRLCVVAHVLELEKTTNTGWVAARMVAGSEVLVHGRRFNSEDALIRDEIASEPDFTGWRPMVLFPTENAALLTPALADGLPVTLIIPDGTWAQARRMHNRIPWMAALPHVTLPHTDRRSGYLLRTSDRENRVSTMEAIAIALGILESQAAESEMLRIFQLLVRRTMAARGTPVANEKPLRTA
ncbi:MAG: DTW domain-containing protein [Clostridia bacterium]|nr:DTW domain-containing protein [Deltaproteobacteria bacterium]